MLYHLLPRLHLKCQFVLLRQFYRRSRNPPVAPRFRRIKSLPLSCVTKCMTISLEIKRSGFTLVKTQETVDGVRVLRTQREPYTDFRGCKMASRFIYSSSLAKTYPRRVTGRSSSRGRFGEPYNSHKLFSHSVYTVRDIRVHNSDCFYSWECLNALR